MENFFQILEGLIGKRGTSIVMREVAQLQNPHPSEIIFTAVNALLKLLGNHGANAIVREIGREVAQRMMKKHPPEKWWELCKSALVEAGYAKDIKLLEDGTVCVGECAFHPNILKPQGLDAAQHPICWIASGFIEEFIRRIKRVKGLRFKRREENCCRLQLLTAENILGREV